eukprot:586624-Lingulodinium_polyedra.AAC.1
MMRIITCTGVTLDTCRITRTVFVTRLELCVAMSGSLMRINKSLRGNVGSCNAHSTSPGDARMKNAH